MTEWQVLVVCALFGGAMFCAGASWASYSAARLMARHALRRVSQTAGPAPALLAEQAQRILTLQAALEPFAEYGRWAVDAEGWSKGGPSERLCDWFGPSEFYAAAQALPGEETSSD